MTSNLPDLDTFTKINDFIEKNYGFSLFLVEEPALMSRHKKPTQWVGAATPGVVLLRRTGYPPTKYPKSRGTIVNGGYRPVSLRTLLSNIKDGRDFYMELV